MTKYRLIFGDLGSVYTSPPPLLAGTPKPGFGRKLFPKAHFEPTGLVFPEEGKKNPERGFTRGGLPPLGFTETERNLERQRGSRLSSCSDAGRRKEKIARGVRGGGGFHPHEPLGGGRKDGTQGGVRGY